MGATSVASPHYGASGPRPGEPDGQSGRRLVELDPADLDVALAQAKAQVAQAEAELGAEDPNVPITETSNHAAQSTASSDLALTVATLNASRADIQQLSAQVAQAEANDRIAQLEKDRATTLVQAGGISQSEFDNRSNTAPATAATGDGGADHVAQGCRDPVLPISRADPLRASGLNRVDPSITVGSSVSPQ
jgi:multidrug resistance efflux pump